MLKFINPFAKHDVSEFPDVLIPLEQAQRHHSVASATNGDTRKSSGEGSMDKEKADYSPPQEDAAGQPTLTLESLRAEIELDLAAGGHDS